jgi:hypothetical protein
MRARAWIVVLAVATGVLLPGAASGAKNFQLRGDNELSGGVGFAASFNQWTVGGFKWFNDYSRRLTKLTWLNFQFNIATGDDYGGRNCWYDHNGKLRCANDDHYRWGGTAFEFAAGVKLKWRLKKIPLVFHAKLGGAFGIELLWSDITGFAFGFRGGFGIRYFFLPTFGVGAEIVPTFGPVFLTDGFGAEFYGAIDFNAGVEWRF